MRNFEEVQKIAQAAYDKQDDVGNIEMMDAVKKMLDGDWELDNAPGFWRNQPSSDPFDAWDDAVALFSPMKAKLKVTPYSGTEQDRRNADLLEQALMWQAARMRNRRGDAHKEIVEDAFAYGRAAAQLVYLPYMSGTMKAFAGSDKRRKAAMRHGDFALVHRDARNVFPIWSDYMLEGVLNVSCKPVSEILDFWGDLAKPLKNHIKGKEDLEWALEFDYWDLDQRCVWVQLAQSPTSSITGFDGIELFNDENKLPFLPWIVADEGEPLRPMLYPIYKFDYWHSMNIMESALVSEAIAYLFAPRYVIQNGELEISYGEVGTQAKMSPTAELKPLPPVGIDPGLSEMVERLKARVSKSTISHNVQSGDFGAGTAYASVREIIDLQSRKLNSGKNIVSKFWEEAFKQMLWYADFTGNELTSYGAREDGSQIVVFPPEKMPDIDSVSQSKMNVLTYNPDNLFFEVEMMPDIPEDQVARMNAAMMYLNLRGSYRRALEIVGVADPAAELDQRMNEDVRLAHHEADKNRIMIMSEMQAQMALQEQQMMQQQASSTGQGFDNLGGQGFAPPMGGIPPQIGNPEGTRETQQGRNVIGGMP